MGVLSTLVHQAQPAIIDAGCEGGSTEDASWKFEFIDVTDTSDNPIDLTTVTAVCKVLDTDASGAEVIELDFTGAADGSFILSATAVDTAGLANGETEWRECRWYLKLDDGTDIVQFWHPALSVFKIYPAGA